MAGRREIMLVTQDPATRSAVLAAIAGNGTVLHDEVCADLLELPGKLERIGAAAVLVDIDGRERSMLSTMETMVRRFPNTRFIVLSRAMEAELMLEAMQTGARHFMIKDSIAATLSGVIHRLCPNGNGAPERKGKAITILSASGGCGATTIAVNLAHEIQLASKIPSLLVDLDYVYGGVSQYLGVDGQHGALDLMNRAGALDSELIHTAAQKYGGGETPMRVLISTAGMNLGEHRAVDMGRAIEVIGACKLASAMTIVDAPRMPLDVAAELARMSEITLLVMQLTVKDVRMTRSMLTGLAARGVDAHSIIPVANRYQKRSLVKLDEAERALQGYELRTLSNDYQVVSHSSNFGEPLAKSGARSVLRRELETMAGEILSGNINQAPVGK